MNRNFLTNNFSEPLNNAKTARVNINAGDGNLKIDRLTDSAQLLASGTLQYSGEHGLPICSLDSHTSQARLTLKRSGKAQPWFRMPWASCNGAAEWQIHLNPSVLSDITAHCDGGNITLDLDGMSVSSISANTGGGNVELVLPDRAANLGVTAKTGAVNVSVSIPGCLAARIHASTGLGKTIVDPRFSYTAKNTYQSPDFETATARVEITVSSGAGSVSINLK